MTVLAADLFCGAGGTSEGMRRAAARLGLTLSLSAVNHWPLAVSTHALNHPEAHHLCANLEDINPRVVVPGGRLDLLVASPECTHHSNARGGKPMNDQSRASAFCVLRWAEALDIKAILIENVPEFLSWGPLGKDNRPLKSKKGQLFNLFVRTLRTLGYRVEWRILCAADFGDPTTRRRLFLIARKGSRPVPWPEPTHVDPKLLVSQDGLFAETRQPWVGARSIIDFSLPSQSIFLRKKRLAATTLARIYAGFEKYGGPNAGPFLVALRRHMDGLSLDDPIPTVCASGNHFGLVETQIVNMKGRSDARPASEPTFTQTAGAPHQYVATTFLHPHLGVTGENRPQDVDRPLGTVTASHGAGKLCEGFILPHPIDAIASGDSDEAKILRYAHDAGLIDVKRQDPEPFLIGQGGPEYGGKPTDVESPLGTVMTDNHRAVVEPVTILPHRKFSRMDADDVDAPLRTVEATNGRQFHLCESVIVPLFSEREGQSPRSHSVDDPLPTVTASKGAGAVAQPFVIDVTHASADQATRAHSIDKPLGTITTARRGEKAVVEGFTVNLANTGDDATRSRPLDDPISTVHAGGGSVALAEGFLVDCAHGTAAGDTEGRRLQSLDAPIGTVTTVKGKAVVEPSVVQFNRGCDADPVEEPLNTVTTKARFGLAEGFGIDPETGLVPGLPTFVTSKGIIQIDVRLRMLRPSELARAHSMDGYTFLGNLEEQVRQIGNGVPAGLAEQLCAAILTDVMKLGRKPARA